MKVINLHGGYRVNSGLVKKIASYVFEYCGLRSDREIELIFLTDRKIRALNKKYKNEDRATDVLSFDLGASGAGVNAPVFGEIFISIDKALKNSKAFKTAFAEELTLYIIHGILHLTGYDDETREARSRMEKEQEGILRNLCRIENLSRVLTPR